MTSLEVLPQECIAIILSRTTPVDAGRLSVVSKTFCSSADSDEVWTRFLLLSSPEVMAYIISHNPSLTKKVLYLALSDVHRPIIIDHGRMGFYLDRKSGKKCYILAAQSLFIPYGALVAPNTNMPPSRFPEVVEIRDAFSLEIRGRINTFDLSRNTQYAAYLVFQMIDAQRFKNCLVTLSVGVKGGYPITYVGFLEPCVRTGLRHASVRNDGWLEIEIGEFFNSGLEEEEVHMSVMEVRGAISMRGFFVEGIEVRTKKTIKQH